MGGAKYLVVEFDPCCNTEKDRDYLDLFNNEGAPLTSSLHGPPHGWPRSQGWPKHPLVVSGNQIVFRFHSDEQFNSRWGYRCLVTGLKLEPAKQQNRSNVSGNKEK